MFFLPPADLSTTTLPISSIYKSRKEEIVVAGPGPQWLGDELRTCPPGAYCVEANKLPWLSPRRAPKAAIEPIAMPYAPAEIFQLTADSPVVAGVASTMFAGSRPLVGIEYDVLSELADELALAQTQSFIPGMR